ncbi:MAG: Ig-like domain-containing protein [Mogibacterium sp.]|nr:Ig-like domain-containing protein [Mogibacterium sp.]MBR4090361.1 Ig-like domain-containing protein [Mogibacterium sp.]
MDRNIKNKRTIILVITVLALVLAAGAYIVVPRGVTQIDLVTDKGETVVETLEIYVGTETQLSCRITPALFMNRKSEYAIADEKIATIDETGLLKALKEGETRLTVECAGTRKNYTIKAETAIEDIAGLKKEITLYEGEEFQLEPKIKMAEKGLEKPEITYKTKRNTIAKVDKNGLITAVSEGKTTITVTAGDISKKIKVIVEAVPVVTPEPVVTVTNDNNDNDNNKATKKKNKKKAGGKSGGNTEDNSGGGNDSGGNSSGGDNGGSGGGTDNGGGGNSEGSSGGSEGGGDGGSDSGE